MADQTPEIKAKQESLLAEQADKRLATDLEQEKLSDIQSKLSELDLSARSDSEAADAINAIPGEPEGPASDSPLSALLSLPASTVLGALVDCRAISAETQAALIALLPATPGKPWAQEALGRQVTARDVGLARLAK